MQFTFAKKSLNFIYAFNYYQQIAINVGLSWPHFSWPTLYTAIAVALNMGVCNCVPLWANDTAAAIRVL